MKKTRTATLEDLDRMLSIEEATFSSPWSRRSFELELKSPLSYYEVLTLSDQIVGYAGAYLLEDEAHIGNVAIDEDFRGNGYGSYLMKHFLFSLYERGVRKATLEVREDNAVAIALYESLGFILEGRRKNYYNDVKKDALIYWRRWGND
ncbi:MAG: ribosomal protein S18-alanine N-acetyltransferase [Tissierellia bacterium]|nr:ribosomal protein S18-alanine N-acetyltransferase [Tissierellia bacterium]